MDDRHYLDHASTSPARPEVVEAMMPWLAGQGSSDPSRIHTEGKMARAALESAREQVAGLFGARPREVVFVSGATEAINSAVWGTCSQHERRNQPARVVAPAVEHSAVLDASAKYKLDKVSVDSLGRVALNDMVAALQPATTLVHCQWGNHEVGTVQPVGEVVAACRERAILVHVDAAQAVGHVPINFETLDADLMSVTAHKAGGPKGIGALLVRRGLRIDPLIVGGEQERARRAGIENVPAAVGFGALAEVLSGNTLRTESQRARQLTNSITSAMASEPEFEILGDPQDRLPHLICVGISGIEAEPVLIGLDQMGIAVHSGSSCSSESLEPSPVLSAMGADAGKSLRISVGWSTTQNDINALLIALPRVVQRLRQLR